MTDLTSLLTRIDAEFSGLDGRIKQAQADHVREHQARQRRLATFETRLADLQGVWRPRLEALIKRFGDKVKATPVVTSSGREATLEFQSQLARIRLRLSASTDHDVRQLILEYDLEIIPILMKFEKHKEAKWPLDGIDEQAVAAWVDDRIIDFVQTYLSLHENEYYLKDHMVEDPVAAVRFPRFAANAMLEFQGKKYYFIGDETRREFATKHGIALS